MKYSSILVALSTLGALGLTSCGGGKPNSLQELLDGLDLVYDHERVAQVEFTTPSGFNVMVGRYLATGTPEYVDAGFRFDDEKLSSVGLRLRAPRLPGGGDSERKYSLRVNFNYFGGKRFHGIDRIHFANNKNDPSLMRELLFSLVAQAMDVPAPRASFAWVKADGQVLGLYTMVEIIDERFVRARAGDKGDAAGGNLYKCESYTNELGGRVGCPLTWSGNRKTDYFVPTGGTCYDTDGCGLVLKSNEKDPLKNDYADLIDFLDFLNNTSDPEFAAGVEERFEVDAFLRYLAVAVFLGDNTGYLGFMDNFYLYRRPDTGRFGFIPWDHNKSMGLTRCANAVHPTGSSPHTPTCSADSRPLVDRILAVDAHRATYLGHLRQLLDTALTPAAMQARVDELEALIVDLIPQDPNYGYTLAQHQIAISDAVAIEDFNLLQYVLERRAYLAAELEEK